MRPTDIAISNYRSIRRLSIPIHPLSVFVGENGVGKSNLYKSLSLLRDAATGQITRTIADEGGLNSVCWSGIRKRGEDGRLRLSATFDSMSYSIRFPGIACHRKKPQARFLTAAPHPCGCSQAPLSPRTLMSELRPDQKCNAGLAILS